MEKDEIIDILLEEIKCNKISHAQKNEANNHENKKSVTKIVSQRPIIF